MTDPNVPSYFLIILCGFGTVWSYRRTIKTPNKIGEFEYVGFSTLWGSIIFLPIAYVLDSAKLLAPLSVMPFIATPSLFIIGYFLGWVSAIFINWLRKRKIK